MGTLSVHISIRDSLLLPTIANRFHNRILLLKTIGFSFVNYQKIPSITVFVFLMNQLPAITFCQLLDIGSLALVFINIQRDCKQHLNNCRKSRLAFSTGPFYVEQPRPTPQSDLTTMVIRLCTQCNVLVRYYLKNMKLLKL